MSKERQVIIYGGSGYTGKLVAESLANREIPFYFAGRNQERLEAALAVVRERMGDRAYLLDAEIVTANNSVATALPVQHQGNVVN